MERDQSSPPLLSPKTKELNNNDRLKRDEWSEGAVSSLLEAYEAKWVLRNRAKLKGQDWEDVAKHVSGRTNNTKSAKTQTQCKNKIESMKKRYRSESVAADASSWPLYSRLDLLLRGNAPAVANPSSTAVILEQSPPVMQKQNFDGSNGVDDRVAKGDVHNNICAKPMDQEPEKISPTEETDSSTPAVYTRKEKLSSKSTKVTMMKRKREDNDQQYWEIGESIRWLAEVVVKSEQARMETMREIERMRVEAEAKRGEMDLKRTEIIANTQLEIAKLFTKGAGGGPDSSLRIGRS